MNISFGKRTIATTGTPQPLLGTTLTAAVVATNASKGSSTTPPGTTAISLPVADSSIFAPGDFVWIDTGDLAERPVVTDIPDGTHIKVSSLQNDHASGANVLVSIDITAVYVQCLSANTGALTIYNNPYYFQKAPSYGRGAQAPSSSSLTQAIAVLEPVASPGQPQELSAANNFGANPDNLSSWWVSGTANDGYLVSVTQT